MILNVQHMNKKNSHLIEKLKMLKEKTISFSDQYNLESKDPDIDFLVMEINKVKEVVLAHTQMKKVIEQKEETLSLLYSYLNDEKFASDQTNLVALLNVIR